MAGNYNLGTATGRILIDGAGAEIGFGIAQKAGSAFFDLIEGQLKALQDFGQNMMKAGAVGAAGFAVAGNAAANYEQRLSAVKAVSGASADEMAKISEAALQIGADTSFSATEAASAFEELVKAGISVQDSLDGAALATANLAAAGEIALPRAAEIAANAMNNFNLAGKDMPRIADLVAGAANASAISVEEFAQSLSQVGAVANLSGISFDDVSVAIAEMGNAGIKGSDAGTSLKTMLMNLQPVTTAQVKKFEELGLVTFSAEKSLAAMAKKGIQPLGSSLNEVRQAVSDYLAATEDIPNDTKQMGKAVDEWLQSNGAMQNAFFDSKGKAKGLADMQDVLAKATAGMSEEQKLASLETLFGADAIRAAAIMAKEGSAGFNELSAAMGKVTAADVAATRLDNVKGSIEKLKGSFETLLIQLGTIFLPIVKRVIDGLTEFVNWLSNASERAKTFGVAVYGIATGLGLIGGAAVTALAAVAPFLIKMAGVALLQRGISGVIATVKFLGIAFATATGPISFYRIIAAQLVVIYGQIAAAAGTAATAVGFFGKVMAFAMGWPGKLIQLVLLLAAIGVTLYNTWEPFRVVVDQVAAVINGVLSTAMGILQETVKKLVDGFNGVEAAADPVSQLLFQLGQIANSIWQDMQRLGQIFMTEVVPALQTLWGILQSAFGDAFAAIGATVQKDLLPALKTLSDVFFNDLFPALQEVGKFLLPIIGFLLQVAGAIIGGFYVALITVISYIIGTVLPAIIQFAGPVLGALIAGIAAVAGFVVTYLITPFIQFITFLTGTVIPAMIAFGSTIFGAIGSALGFIGDVIGNVVNFIGGVISSVSGFFAGMGAAADTGASGISDAFAGIAAFFAPIVEAVVGFVTGVVNTIVTGFTAVATFLAPAVNLWLEIFTAVWNVIFAITNGIVSVIVAVVQFMWGTIMLMFQVASATISQAWNDFWTTIWAALVAIGIAISVTWQNLWNGFMAFLQPILDWLGAVIPAAWNIMVAAIAAGSAAVWNIITDAWNNTVSFFTTVLQIIQAMIMSRWQSIVNSIRDAMNWIRSVVEGAWNWITGAFRNAVIMIDSATGGGFTRMVATVQGAMAFLGMMINQRWEEILGFFRSIPGTIQSIFAGAASWLGDAGRMIIDGLLGGLRAAAGAITDFFKGITDSIPQVKGPPEHDKVMLIPAGKMIMHSLWKGLDAGKDAIYDLLGDMNATIPATVNAVLDPNLQGAVDGVLSGKASYTTINKAPIVNVAPAEVTANFNAKVLLGTQDITDMVDLHVEEIFDGASTLITTGVNA